MTTRLGPAGIPRVTKSAIRTTIILSSTAASMAASATVIIPTVVVTATAVFTSAAATFSASSAPLIRAVAAMRSQNALIAVLAEESEGVIDTPPTADITVNIDPSFDIGQHPIPDDPYEALLVLHDAVENIATRLGDKDFGLLGDVDALSVFNSQQTAVRRVGLDYGIKTSDKLIVVVAGSAVNLFLPTPSENIGKDKVILNNSAFAVTVAVSDGSNVDGVSSILVPAGTKLPFVTDGIEWFSI